MSDDNDSMTWSDGDLAGKAKAFEAYSKVHESYNGVSRANHNSYIDIEPNRSVKPGFTSRDYYAFRPDEQVPKQQKRIIKMCMDAYDKVGIVRNIIDLMGDFGCQGVDLVHENPSVERFYKKWFKKIGGKERSERYLNNLYRTGNVFVYRSNAKITDTVRKYLKTLATDIVVEPPSIERGVIPWRYNFLNPLAIDMKNGNVDLFLGKKNYELTASTFFDNFKDGTIPTKILETLPPEVKRAIIDKQQKITLDPERLCVCYYKKDDWQAWAHPMVYAILDDIIMLEKMKLADLAALDGAISNIRLWTIGDFEHKILPTKNCVNKLRNVLASNPGGGTMELVWGPELKFTESNTQVHKFLGPQKYEAVLNSIFAGLGVPPTLTGMAGGGGFTNNFISLKTLTERLQYGRDHLTKFWEIEIEAVRAAMGFRKAAHIIYDQMSLSDEAAEKNLLIQLADRDIISNETILERFKEVAPVERLRLQREDKARENDKMPQKASPYHNPSHDQDMEKIVKQGQINEKIAVKKEKSKPTPSAPQGGRPANKMDTNKRKKRVDTPRNKPGVAELAAWTIRAYDSLEGISKGYLELKGKKNRRQLNKAEVQELTDIKFRVLSSLPILSDIDNGAIHRALASNTPAPTVITEAIKELRISLENTPMDEYESTVIGLYIDHFNNISSMDFDENGPFS
jgi:hypothetical protein